MSELPKGWVELPLEHVASWGSGGTPKRSEPSYYGGDVPWVKTGDLGPRYLKEASEYISQLGLEKSSAKLFPKGSVAIAMYGATIGKTSTLDFEASTNQACAVGNPIDGVILTDFLYYFLTSEKQNFIKKGKGGAQPNISQQLIKAHEIQLPSLAEQKRIVEKLDEVLAQVDTIKARLDGIPALLKRFRQSVLASAVSGKLTEEWRTKNSGFERSSDLLIRWLSERKNNFHKEQERLIEDGRIKRARKYKEPVKPNLEKSPELFPETWTTVSVSQFAECLDSMRIPVKKEDRASARGLYPYFGANGLVDKVDEYIFDDELVLVTEDETFYGRTKPIAYRSSGKCWVNNHAHVLRASTKAANDYLCYALMYKNVEPWLSGSTGRAKLTQAALNEIPLGLPPEAELNKIVALVDQYFTFAYTIEAQVKKAQARVDNLTQSILAKAFRGELVPQDPNDEPADKLLERIAQARKEAEALAKAAKKAGATKKKVAKSA
ncbi:restriction endonuclease subunit S [Photobacterium damselae]|uniref:restriction endonuclease subunit S n=1 Tax=Photobacterium damselae TaxID=38293 RepID=UPI0011D10D83|nr:restriction endonuclease subunit S [Photobacterium damselae]KAB1513275.1 type I restriction endonuclease subunit S [Photobacterium damselae subsp. damselae]